MTVAVVGPPRDPCPDLEPECFQLPFCEAWLCAVELRRGLTGELAHCPVSGIPATVQYGAGGSQPPGR